MGLVVLGSVEAVARIQGQGRILDEGGGRQGPLFKGQGVEKGLEGGAGLAQGGDPIHFRRLREVAAGADPGQDFAAGVVQHQHRAVFHVLLPQGMEVASQGVAGELLQVRIQAGTQGLAGLLQ